MYELSTERKRYLLQQNRQSRLTSNGSPNGPSAVHNARSYGPSSSGALLPRLVPQLTGDAGLIRRFSMAGWGNTAAPALSPSARRSKGEIDSGGNSKVQMEKVAEEMQPLQPQTTGGLWSSWWASSGGDKGRIEKEQNETAYTARWYVDGIRAGRPTDIKLVKHLISLRVHLSTAKLVWIEEFVDAEKGLDALRILLADLVGKGGKRKVLVDVESTVLLEVIKCLRVLLNTEASGLFSF
jgi:diaphanous 1